MEDKRKLFSCAGLKRIAVLSMLIDHFGAAFFIIYTSYYDGSEQFPFADEIYYYVLRGIGRTAFPIFCFVLVEGFFYTRSRLRYFIRLCCFSLLSEIPFDLSLRGKLWDFDSQNVFWTLLIGFSAMCLMDTIRKSQKGDIIFRTSLCAVAGLLSLLLAETIKTDYSAPGVLLILVLYYFRDDRKRACMIGYICMLWEFLCFPGFLCIYFYNGKKGRGLKYFYYVFYPLHLLMLYGLRRIVL